MFSEDRSRFPSHRSAHQLTSLDPGLLAECRTEICRQGFGPSVDSRHVVATAWRSDQYQVEVGGQVSVCLYWLEKHQLSVCSRNKAILVAAKDSEYGKSSLGSEFHTLILSDVIDILCMSVTPEGFSKSRCNIR